MSEKLNKNNKATRALPYNAAAEASVLGSIMIDSNAGDIIIPLLKVDSFYIAQNRIIFETMRELQLNSKPIDMITVADKLELEGKINNAGGIEYLTELTEIVPSSASGEHYAQIVKRDSLIRKVIEVGNRITKIGYESEEGSEALQSAEKLIFQLAETTSDSALVKADNALAEAIKDIQDAQTGNVPLNVVFTDIASLDRKTKGLKPGEFILIAARPSVGKTALALNFAANACLNHAKTVAVFSLEMPAPLLVKRMLSYVSKVSLTKMSLQGGLSSKENNTLLEAYYSLMSANLFIDDYSLNSPNDILSKCRRLKREKGLDLIIIDYLQLMSTGKRVESRQTEVSEMSRNLKIFAKELDVPIIALSQMSRSVDQRTDHTPLLSDLRESGSIEQDADIVMFLYNKSKFNPALPENVVTLDIKKNRNGPIGEIDLEWDGDTTSFKECVDGVSAQIIPHSPKIAVMPPKEEKMVEVKGGNKIMPFSEVASGVFEGKEIADDVPPFKADEDEYGGDFKDISDEGDGTLDF